MSRKLSPLIQIEKLKKYYPVLGGVFKRKVADVRAVDDVTLEIYRGECLGLVGESGCGKTTLGKTVIRLLDPTSGHIYFDAPEEVTKEIRALSEELERSRKTKSMSKKEFVKLKKKLKKLRKQYDLATFSGTKLNHIRRRMQIVYQDPTTSLDPRMLVKDIVGEPLVVQKTAKGAKARERVLEILQKVGLSEQHLYRYPHEFSGGQRQRIAIARALVVNPEFVVLDEPTSSVDVSVRAQLLNLFQDLRREMGLTYLFVSHDLGVVECISHRTAVMYLGKVIEIATTEELFQNPLHPYTQALMSSIPVPDPTMRVLKAPLKGEVPSPINPPLGCRFHPRCSFAKEICREEEPRMVDAGKSHYVACHIVTR